MLTDIQYMFIFVCWLNLLSPFVHMSLMIDCSHSIGLDVSDDEDQYMLAPDKGIVHVHITIATCRVHVRNSVCSI